MHIDFDGKLLLSPEHGLFVGHLAHYLFPIRAILSMTPMGKLISSNGRSGGYRGKQPEWKGGDGSPTPTLENIGICFHPILRNNMELEDLHPYVSSSDGKNDQL